MRVLLTQFQISKTLYGGFISNNYKETSFFVCSREDEALAIEAYIDDLELEILKIENKDEIVFVNSEFEKIKVSRLFKIKKNLYSLKFPRITINNLPISKTLPANQITTVNEEKLLPLEFFKNKLQNKQVSFATLTFAFYLPQFHEIKENNEFWGEGFTEWSNVKKSQPKFEGHVQPIEPFEIGYYDLTDLSAIKLQDEIASTFELNAFCSYYYQFGDKIIMQKPLKSLLHEDLKTKTFICWANENWTRRWDGLDQEILLKQNYENKDFKIFAENCLSYFNAKNYFTYMGCPVLLIYRPADIPNCKTRLKQLRNHWARNGFSKVVIGYVRGYSNPVLENSGFDFSVDFPPNSHNYKNITSSFFKPNNNKGQTKIYHWGISKKRDSSDLSRAVRCVNPGWDNSPRREHGATILLGSTPQKFSKKVTEELEDSSVFSHNSYMLAVNAWNEWAEGAILEPSKTYGYQYLAALQNGKAIFELKKTEINSIKILGHIHVFYMNVFTETILPAIKHIHDVKWVISYSDSSYKRIIEQKMKGNNFETLFVANRGRDVIPFLQVVQKYKNDNYSHIFKLHTKLSSHRKDGEQWGKSTINCITRFSDLENIANKMLAQNIGMLGPESELIELNYYLEKNKNYISLFSGFLGIDLDDFNPKVVFGNMFLADFRIFKVPIFSYDFASLAPEELGQVDGTIMHALERLFSIAALSLNLNIQSIENLMKKRLEQLKIFEKKYPKNFYYNNKSNTPSIGYELKLDCEVRKSEVFYSNISGVYNLKVENIVLHIHVHYLNTLKYILTYYEPFLKRFNLYITVSEERLKQEIMVLLSEHRLTANIIIVENYGRNIGALYQLISKLDLDFDYLIHIHTKRGGENDNYDWLDHMVDGLITLPSYDFLLSNTILNKFSIFMPDYFDEIRGNVEIGGNLNNLQELLAPDLKWVDVLSKDFPAGFSFLCSKNILLDFARKFSGYWKRISEQTVNDDGAIIHAFERYFFYLAFSKNERVMRFRDIKQLGQEFSDEKILIVSENLTSLKLSLKVLEIQKKLNFQLFLYHNGTCEEYLNISRSLGFSIFAVDENFSEFDSIIVLNSFLPYRNNKYLKTVKEILDEIKTQVFFDNLHKFKLVEVLS